MESRQKGLSRKNNAPERRIDRKRENFSRFWLGATSSATHTLSFRRLIKKEHNSWVQLSTAAVPRHLSRCNFWPHFLPPAFLFRRICVFHFPVVLLVSSPVTSVTRLSRSPLICWRPKCKEWEGRPNCAIDPDCYETSRCVRMKKKTTTYNNTDNKKPHRL